MAYNNAVNANTTGILTLSSTGAATGSAVTQHGVLLGGASNAVSSLGVATSNTLLQGATGADPSFQSSPVVSGTISAQSGYVGNTTAPSAGNIGEQIRATQTGGTSLSNNTYATLTSISLTAGIWDVTGIVNTLSTNATTTTNIQGGISSSNSAFSGTQFDNYFNVQPTSNGSLNSNTTISVPSYRVVLTMTTTYYLAVIAAFSGAGVKGYGRISATRVG